MDEILASIRRIIEDNDAGQPGAATQGDVLAQVNSAFQANDVANRPQLNAVVNKDYAPETAEPEVPVFSASSTDSNFDLTEVPQTLMPHQMATDAEAAKASDNDVFSAAVEEKGGTIVDVTATAEEPTTGTNLANMISNQAAERVAASFGALTEAVDASKDSPLTAMTEEMLQPMLREWLDNNLPVIVERLVREEIERLARGEM